MLRFVTAVSVVLVVSFLCSIFESVLLSLTRPQVEVIKKRHRSAGRLLSRFKENMDVPIAAILILNTAAHTIGAAVAGASYENVFDASTLWLFSILCLAIGIYPQPLYAILPYPVDYQPYTVDHLVTQFQVLLFAGFAFFVMLKQMRRTLTISLDFDWFYRKFFKEIGG